jgi:hypothetical protein
MNFRQLFKKIPAGGGGGDTYKTSCRFIPVSVFSGVLD